jgi:hypothetical protein
VIVAFGARRFVGCIKKRAPFVDSYPFADPPARAMCRVLANDRRVLESGETRWCVVVDASPSPSQLCYPP